MGPGGAVSPPRSDPNLAVQEVSQSVPSVSLPGGLSSPSVPVQAIPSMPSMPEQSVAAGMTGGCGAVGGSGLIGAIPKMPSLSGNLSGGVPVGCGYPTGQASQQPMASGHPNVFPGGYQGPVHPFWSFAGKGPPNPMMMQQSVGPPVFPSNPEITQLLTMMSTMIQNQQMQMQQMQSQQQMMMEMMLSRQGEGDRPGEAGRSSGDGGKGSGSGGDADKKEGGSFSSSSFKSLDAKLVPNMPTC